MSDYAYFTRPAWVLFSVAPLMGLWVINNIFTLKSGLQVTQSHWKWYHRKLGYSSLFAFHSNYGPILYHFQDKARYALENCNFLMPASAFDAPVRVSPSENCHNVWCRKMTGVANGRWESLRIWLLSRCDTITACDNAHRRTDILRQHSPRYA